MRDFLGYWIGGSVLTVWLLGAWFTGSLLGLHGADLWILRSGLALVGIAGFLAFIWWVRSKSASQAPPSEGEQPPAPARGGDEIDLLIRDAEGHLASSGLGRGARIGHLPVILLVGESGSAKTSTMVHSGLDPELLAGHVYQDGSIVPTRAANIWFAQQTIFVEAGGKLLSEPARWTRLIRRLAPGKLQSVVGKREQAPRAVVVCFDCENFVKPGGGEAVSLTARNLYQRLGEISQLLGITFPVYVLFTKVDRLAFFDDYARNLSNEEATRVLGVTLPIQPGLGTGVYAERETQRLTAAFSQLFHSLADKRLDFLHREHSAQRLPGVYEFPREFRKLRTSAVQFLVDLCRPSQLRAGPFLRGFYFGGLRAVMMTAIAPAARERHPVAPAPIPATSATRIMDVAQLRAEAFQAPPPRAAEARKVPQWMFLSHLFNDVLLRDRSALGASSASARVSLWRRILLATAAALFLFWSIALVVSFVGNRSLESEVLSAAQGISASESSGLELPSLDALSRLETLRQSAETLARYEREGAPWRLRWGLYVGSRLYPEVLQIYFSRFRQLLYTQTQAAMLQRLLRLPSSPAPSDPYGAVYDTLKAYLITTSHHDKSTRLFLAPVLLRMWSEGREVDPDRMQLAQRQFDFYSEQLKEANPFSSEHDTLAVERGRRYLSQFAGTERVYQFMLAEASKENPSIQFNRQFPGTGEAVVNNREMVGAFAKSGWSFMQDAIKHADRYFSGEQWVLGDQGAGVLDRAKLEQELRARYLADFISRWREFLRGTYVAPYGSLRDADRKLQMLAGNQSPLLALFCVASQNTAVDSADVASVFQPLQSVVPPDCKDQYIKPPNANYMKALVGLQASIERVASSGAAPSEMDKQAALTNATNAKIVTREMAQGFRIDKEGHVEATVQKLMEDPITYAERVLGSVDRDALNAKGRALCSQFRELMAKYPFNPATSQQAGLTEVAAIFRPGDGALARFYEENLKSILPLQGSEYVPGPATSIKLNPAFVSFFNRAAAVGRALYPAGSQQMQYQYSLRPLPTEGIQSSTLAIDGQQFKYSGGSAPPKQFAWPGTAAQGVRLTVKVAGGSELGFPAYDGPWAIFYFFADADRWQATPSGANVEWVLRVAGGRPVTLPNGKPVTVQFELDTKSNPPIFQKAFFSNLSCVPMVAR